MFDYECHEQYMRKILHEIFTSSIKDFLAFKGGTLTYFCYGLERFSTDIDLDILNLDKETEIIDTMREILYVLGEVKNETLGKTLHRWIFRYDEKSMNIKVELNKRVRKSNTYDFQEIDGIKIPTMAPESIFANKVVALSERFKNRDLYDVYFFLKHNFPLNENIIMERTGKNMNDFIEEMMKSLPLHYTKNTILADL